MTKGGGHGDKQSRKEDEAIAALLSCPTIVAAAKHIGIGEETLRRWLAQPDFRARYREARQQVVQHAITRLQSATTVAVETLERNMGCGMRSTEVAAAKAVLEQAFNGATVDELIEWLEELERRANDKSSYRNGGLGPRSRHVIAPTEVCPGALPSKRRYDEALSLFLSSCARAVATASSAQRYRLKQARTAPSEASA